MQASNCILVAALLVATTAHASPVLGGYCGIGTLNQYIALGSTGCFFPVDGERIYDFSVSLPESVDPSTIVMGFGSGGDSTATWREAAGHFFPIGAQLSLKWSAPADREMTRVEWYQFDSGGNLSTHALPATLDGEMTMVATIANAYLGFQLELAPLTPQPYDPPRDFLPGTRDTIGGVPEPSSFLPLIGIGLLCVFGKRKLCR